MKLTDQDKERLYEFKADIALLNPHLVRTRSGQRLTALVRLPVADAVCPLVGMVEGLEFPLSWSLKGKQDAMKIHGEVQDNGDTAEDLFLVFPLSQPLPGPNPGGATAEELGEEWELFDSEDGSNKSEWFNVETRTWHREDPPCDYTRESYSRYSWRRPKKPLAEAVEKARKSEAYAEEGRELAATEPASTEGSFYDGIEWLAAWLVDHCEGETVTEELARRWAIDAWNGKNNHVEPKFEQPTPPNPGPRHRLVDTKTEKPREDAEIWNVELKTWFPRPAQLRTEPYGNFHYRVPKARRLVPPTGDELLGQKVRLKSWAPNTSSLVVDVDDGGFIRGGAITRVSFGHVTWITEGERTDPADTTKWIPWAKEVWE